MSTEGALKHALNGADLVIHLGAGRCRELSEYLSDDSRQVVLVEANPKMARELRAKTGKYSNVHVIERAVSGSAGEAVLYVYSLAEHSSLRKPTALLDHYPGLRVIEQVPLRVHAAASVLTELDWDDVRHSCLVLDVPGEELSILEGLLRDNMLKRINSLILTCAPVAMFEGAGSRQEVAELLDGNGFEILAEVPEGAFSSVLVFGRNEWKLENARLRGRLLALELERERLRQELSRERAIHRESSAKKDVALRQLEEEVRQRKEECERHRAHLDKVVEEKRTEICRCENERAAIQERLDCLTEELANVRAALASKEAELQAVLQEDEQHKRDSARYQQLVHEEQERLRKLREQHDAALQQERKRAHEQGQKNELLQEELGQLKAETHALEQELADARRNMGMALRIQLLRENDLKELQERYGKVLDLTKRQDELLRKLHQRLTVAAEFLEQIRSDDLASVDQLVARRLMSTLTLDADET